MTSSTPAETPDTREHDHSTGIPLFAADAQLDVRSIDGPQTWTGAEWNEYVIAATRRGDGIAERLIACPAPVCTTRCPAAATPAETPDTTYRVTLAEAFIYAARELTIPAALTADEIATVIRAELTGVGYADLGDITVNLGAGRARIIWQGGECGATITGPGIGEQAERTYLVQFGDHLPHFRSFEITSTSDQLAGEIHGRIDPGGNWDFEVVLAEDGGTAQVVNDDGSDSGYGTLTITEVPQAAAPAVAASHLHVAVVDMAARYGLATQTYAYALNASGDERARHLRAARRRFIALQRLTRALANLAGGAK